MSGRGRGDRACRPVAQGATGAVVGLAVLLGGCGADPALTLADVGAQELAGQSGDGLAERCNTLPMPATLRGVECSEGESGSGGSVGDHELEAGTYAVVLLCDGAGSYTLTVERPEVGSPETTVDCPAGSDPAVVEAFTLTDGGLVSTRSTTSGGGYVVAMLLAVPS